MGASYPFLTASRLLAMEYGEVLKLAEVLDNQSDAELKKLCYSPSVTVGTVASTVLRERERRAAVNG